ncbi:PREDICTED: alpha-1B adrenergic receptor-like [Acropora digitifera]|uniref:alpha-1B adrenergic receptor-like n=1 Tax=Acropora digitifera TaxID=70779 RepID=UPI00077A376A|nr:PREDICTED: alpha-1B adrenergic receptor-like [Acropora digitifera]
MSNDDKELTDCEYILLCVLNAFFALTAVVLNSVTIHAIRKTSSASLPKNLRVLLLNLAFSDLSVGLVVQPIYIIHLTFLFESQEGDNLHIMDTLTWVIYIGIAFVCASILGVLALIVDRFLAVYLHLRYQEIVTPKRVVFILILSWVISTIASLFWIGQEYHDFLVIFINVFLATCLTTIALLQFKIYSIVRRHKFQIRAQQVQGSKQTEDETRATFERQKSSVRSAFYIYLLLLACYLPNIFITSLHEMLGKNFQILDDYTLTLVFVNSCLNPLIYCWKLRHVRRTIRMILRNIFVRVTMVQAAVEIES